jgi:hypothetical protein
MPGWINTVAWHHNRIAGRFYRFTVGPERCRPVARGSYAAAILGSKIAAIEQAATRPGWLRQIRQHRLPAEHPRYIGVAKHPL